MDEEEIDSLTKSRPFGTADVAAWETKRRAKTRLAMTLGPALWGRTPADLERQLVAPHPEIPPGFDLADFRELLQWATEMASAVLVAQKMRGLSSVLSTVVSPSIVFVGTRGFTEWQARREIVRRVIEHLENR